MTINLNEGFTLRQVTLEDVEAVVGVINSFSQAHSGIDEEEVDEVLGFWKTPGLDLAADTRALISSEGELVGYAEAIAWNDIPVHPYIFQRVKPAFVGSAGHKLLLEWAIERCKDALPRVPQEFRVAIGLHSLSGLPVQEELLKSLGLQVTRHVFEMGVDIAEEPAPVAWPEGIELRPFDVERDVAKVYLAHEEAFSDHFGHVDEEYEKGLARFRHLLIEEGSEFDKDLWFIAMSGDEVAGYLVGRKKAHEDGHLGWINILGVRRPWRKLGLGQALLQHSFGEFYRRGWKRAELDVDASSLTGAVRLYERVGMQVVRRHDRYELELRHGKELMTTEVE